MFAVTSRSDVPLQPTASGCASLPRSFGALDLQFVSRNCVTQADRVFQMGVMRARFPNVARPHPPETVLINTAGGLTGGDWLKLSINMAAETSAVITTQAHEKVYRSVLGDASISSHIRVEKQARLDWLPQPTILFDGARLSRETRVDLSAEATFLGVESVIFGRTAMDETMRSGYLRDVWEINRDGRIIYADCFDVSGDVAAMLARPSILAGHAAMATLRYVAPDAANRLDDLRGLIEKFDVDGAVSGWNGMLIARIVAANGYMLHRTLVPLLTGFRGRALPAVWSL